MSILNKLGLYRASEVNSILKWATEVSLAADKVIEEAKTPTHAALVLTKYCQTQQDCDECMFHNGECKLAHTPPCWWKVR